MGEWFRCFVCGKPAQSRTNDGTWLCKDCVNKLGGFWEWNKIWKMSADEISEIAHAGFPRSDDTKIKKYKSEATRIMLVFLAIYLIVMVICADSIGRIDNKTIIAVIALSTFLLFIGIVGLSVWLMVKTGKLNKAPRKDRPTISTEQMTGIQFEKYCGMLLKEKYGFVRVEYTKASGDFGGDLIGYHQDGTKWVVQCKRYAGSVGIDAVQEVLGALMFYDADKMAVMTTSTLTASARQLAEKSGVKLYENISGRMEI